MQGHDFCFWTNKAMSQLGLAKLGYDSWDALWADYTVFTLTRNPYDRAASLRDSIVAGHKVRSGLITAPPVTFVWQTTPKQCWEI